MWIVLLRSSDYDYRVYISANENDAIFSNDVLLTALFDGIYVRAKEEFYKVVPPAILLCSSFAYFI